MKSLLEYLNEARGLYDGCKEHASIIYSKILKEYNEEKEITFIFSQDDFKKTLNCFFKELYIKIIIDSSIHRVHATYSSWEDVTNYEAFKYDKKAQLLNFVNINVRIPDILGIDDIQSPIEHELGHAFDDYNRFKNNAKPLYKTIVDSDYAKINSTPGDNKYTSFVKNIEYFTSDWERNAFIGQIIGIVRDKSTKVDSLDELYKYIEKNKHVSGIFDIIDKLYEWKDSREWRYVTMAYNKMFKKSYSEQRVYSILSNKINKFKHKLESHVRQEFLKGQHKYKIIDNFI